MFLVGDVIGPFTLVRVLGRGGNGEVWLAERRGALAVSFAALKFPYKTDPKLVRLEAQNWVRASGHPNVVPVIEADLYNGQVVIASEYIAGGSLAEWLKAHNGAAPSIQEAVRMVCGVLAGLQHLHDRGICHRDLKPENVMIQAGMPRLTDFGLARQEESGDGPPSGTPGYMALEVFQGSYSFASDIWSAGVMLYLMLSGTLPYPAGDLYQALFMLMETTPAPLPDTVPEALRAVVTRAIAKSAEDRFASAAEMAQQIQAAIRPVMSLSVSPSASSAYRNNLPHPTTSFIGRERLLREAKARLADGRNVTLTGAGGGGKTRLALRIAEELSTQYEDGVWFVDLAPLTDPALVLDAVVRVISPADTKSIATPSDLQDRMRGKRMLIILDNCEHLLDVSADIAARLLSAGQGVHVLATSRAPLRISGEQVLPVAPLTTPLQRSYTPEEVKQFEAVQLLVDRTRGHNAEFGVTSENAEAVVRICRELDGIPLAIELAAARLRSLSVFEVAERIEDRFRLLKQGPRAAQPRQQTLKALVDWSYGLLSKDEALVLACVSIFHNGWDLAAAEAVLADAGIDCHEALDLLTSLVDQSLVQYVPIGTHSRYRLLETIRHYAMERLVEYGRETALRQAHARYFAKVALEAEPELSGNNQKAWFDRLEIEHDNLRVALRTAESAEERLIMAVQLHRFWHVRGYLKEGLGWIGPALNDAAGVSTEWQARGHNAAGVLSWSQGDLTAARGHFEQALPLFEAIGDTAFAPRILGNLGLTAVRMGDTEAAERYLERSLEIFREQNDRMRTAQCLLNLGGLYSDMMQWDRARVLIIESLVLARSMNQTTNEAIALYNLASVHSGASRHRLAIRLLLRGLRVRMALGDKRGIAMTVLELAINSVALGNYAAGMALFDCARTLREQIGMRLDTAEEERVQPYLVSAKSALSADELTEAHTHSHPDHLGTMLKRIREVLAG